jgi:6-phosphogluconolactonase
MKKTRGVWGASILVIAAGLAIWCGCSSDNTQTDGGITDAAPDSNGGGDAAPPDAGRDSTTSDAGGDSTALDGETDSLSDSGPVVDSSDAAPGKEVVYANSGTSLNVFDLNPSDGTLTLKPTLTTVLPQVLQFADFDTTKQHFYVGATLGTAHYLYAFSIDQASGGLTPIGPIVDGGAADGGNTQGVLSPNGRVINLTLSRDGKYLLTVHNVTKAYSVFQLAADGTIGAQVPQADGGDMNVGAFVHQIRVDPSNQYALVCDRGNDPSPGVDPDGGAIIKPEDVGHLRTFSYSNGVLSSLQTITFPSGVGPRHLDFHPTKPWVYVSAERGNRLITYAFQSGMLTAQFNKTSVAVAADGVGTNNQEGINGQRAGAIMVHPSGKYLWMTNRNYAVMPYTPDGGTGGAGDAGSSDGGDGGAPATVQVFTGTGENNVVLFTIDQTTGEPTQVAAADSHGFEPRTFALDPSQRFLVVGNQKMVNTLTNTGVVTVMPNLSVFQVAADGKLTFVKSYDQSSGEVWWVGGKGVTGP